MDNLDLIEAATGGPFVYRYKSEPRTAPSPIGMSFQEVLMALEVSTLPGLPRMPRWKSVLLVERWSAHYDLGDFQSAQRLAYLIDKYRSALVYDLQTFCGADLGELWRSRRWRTALDLIDHLPAHSWYSTAVSGDEEHARMIAESLAAREDEGEKHASSPAMNTWTPEVAKMTEVLDAIKRLTYVILAVNGDKTSQPPDPSPRPHSPLENAILRARHQKRTKAHQDLVARMLPHKAEPSP